MNDNNNKTKILDKPVDIPNCYEGDQRLNKFISGHVDLQNSIGACNDNLTINLPRQLYFHVYFSAFGFQFPAWKKLGATKVKKIQSPIYFSVFGVINK